MKHARLCLALTCLAASACLAQDEPQLFKKITLSDQFYGEGASFGDFNKDGKMDVVSGPFWYEGPDFQKKHPFMAPEQAKSFDPHGYSKNFLAFVHDFNGDGWPDILIVGFPGEDVSWYENPKGKDGPWPRHEVAKPVDNESPGLVDLFKNDKPVLLCMSGGFIGYFQPDWSAPEKPWAFHKISPKGGYQRFTHGIGFGDVNADGRNDILEATGWWEQPASLEGDPVWTKHEFKFGQGGAQMHVLDVNGDGLPDVITSIQAHKYGLAWFEQIKKPDGKQDFVQHTLMGEKFTDSPYGVKFTEMHAIAIADMDKDGLPDIITGKRWWAHGPAGDPEANAPAVLYWLRLVRTPDGKVDYRPYKIDDNSGVGTQVTVGDLDGDGYPDIIVGNKKGTFVFISQLGKLTKAQIDQLKPHPTTVPAPAEAKAP